MPDINEMMTSNYMKKEDLQQPTRFTIAGCEKKNVGTDEKPEYKWVTSFSEDVKPLILNATNIKAFSRTTKEGNSDNWVGKQVILFNDMSVEYQGKFGGIRVYEQMQVADAQPASQFTADNNLAPPPEDTTDYTETPNFP